MSVEIISWSISIKTNVSGLGLKLMIPGSAVKNDADWLEMSELQVKIS